VSGKPGCFSTLFAIVGLGIIFGVMCYSAKAVTYILEQLGVAEPRLGILLIWGVWIGGFYLIYRLAKSKAGA
jgi:hypothetical protein